MKFSELKPGDIFMPDIDADGHEPVWTLLDTNGTLAHEHGRTTATSERLTPDTLVIKMGSAKLNAQPTDIERAAITLLARDRATHPVLRFWMDAIASNPNEMRPLYVFAWEERNRKYSDDYTLQSICEHLGFAYPRTEWDRDVNLHSLIWDGTPAGEYTKRNNPVNAQYDKNGGRHDRYILALADAIVDYRQAGRPDGDQTHTIMGMGAPLMRVSTSLAAAVVEYHVAVVNEIYFNQENADRIATTKTEPTVPAPRIRTSYPNGRTLDCGCIVYESTHVMTSSSGSSCPDCYDRMSE